MSCTKFLVMASLLSSLVLGDVSDLTRLREALFTNYEPGIIPLNYENYMDMRLLTPQILSSAVDENNNRMALDIWMGMQWNDTRLTWDEGAYGGYKNFRGISDEVWKPDIVVYNNKPSGDTMKEWSRANVIVYYNGSVLWVPTASINIPCEHEAANWPFDTIKCTATIGSWTYNGEQLRTKYIKTAIPEVLGDYRADGEWLITDGTSDFSGKVYPCCPDETYYLLTIELVAKRIAPMKALYIVIVIALVMVKLISLRILLRKDKSSQYTSTLQESASVSLKILFAEMILLGTLILVIPSTAKLPYLVCFVILMIITEIISLYVYGMPPQYKPM